MPIAAANGNTNLTVVGLRRQPRQQRQLLPGRPARQRDQDRRRPARQEGRLPAGHRPAHDRRRHPGRRRAQPGRRRRRRSSWPAPRSRRRSPPAPSTPPSCSATSGTTSASRRSFADGKGYNTGINALIVKLGHPRRPGQGGRHRRLRPAAPRRPTTRSSRTPTAWIEAELRRAAGPHVRAGQGARRRRRHRALLPDRRRVDGAVPAGRRRPAGHRRHRHRRRHLRRSSTLVQRPRHGPERGRRHHAPAPLTAHPDGRSTAMTITEATVGHALDVRPLAGHIGAEIHGVDISRPLDAATVDAIRTTWLRWKVVFFRDQRLDHASHVRFARQFGDPTPAHPLFDSVGDPEHPAVYPVFKDRFKARYDTSGFDHVAWHADVTAAINPPAASILRGDVVPAYGGDTSVRQHRRRLRGAVAAAATARRRPARRAPLPAPRVGDRRLPPPSRRPTARHRAPRRAGPPRDRRAGPVREPVVHLPPRRRLAAREPPPARPVLRRPRPARAHRAVQVGARAAWRSGTTGPSCTSAPSDHGHLDGARSLYRVTLVGDVPVGPDGRPSVAIEGAPFEAL